MSKNNEKMRILIIFNSLIGVIGGGSRHIVEVANRWIVSNDIHYLISNEGYNVAVDHIGAPHENKKIIKYDVTFDSIRKFHLAYISRTVKSAYLCYKMRNEYDVVVAPNYLPQNIIPAIFMKSKKTKLVVYFHTTPLKERSKYLKSINVLKRNLSYLNWYFCTVVSERYFDLVFVINKSTKNYFVNRKVASQKVEIISNAIPYQSIVSIKTPTIRKYDCVFLGRLVKSKGILDIVKIWSIVTIDNPTAKICILGDGPDRDELEKEIRKNSLENNVFVYGQAENDEKYRIMKDSNIFLYPSYYESQGIVILEALACELTVVAYNLPTYNEFYDDYLNTVEVGDFQEMADLVKAIIKWPEKYRKQREDIKNFISNYDWGVVSKNQELLLKR
ncbi:glycosyltransferase family 4 protein [Methanolobus sp. ZRKC2]|uniref:glycosyltransferase family 4 protein n=1 Tax=Methanolobus sp. ZRKC2 TaxID=3125783 RepID=UPI003244906A